jgi:aminomethyltransferase
MTMPVGLRPTPFSPRYPGGISDWIDVYGFAVPVTLGDPLAEYRAVRSTAGAIEYSMLYKWEVNGPGAVACVNAVFSRNVATQRPGRLAYGVIVNDDGFMVDDVTVAVHGPQQIVVTGGNPATEEHLAQAASPATVVTQRRDHYAVLSLQGPRSRQVLQALTATPVGNHELPYYNFITGVPLAGIPAQVSRVGFTAELGYELQVPADRALELWDAVLDAGRPLGLVPFSAAALMMCRVEGGMIMGGLEYDDTITPFECRMGWAVDFGKGPFQGRTSLLAKKDTARDRVVSVTLGPGEVHADGAALMSGNTQVGYVTMAVTSPYLGRVLGLARIRKDFSSTGTRLRAALDGGREIQAEIVATPVYDPERTRVRS